MSRGNPATRARLDQHGNMALVLAYRAGMVYNHLSLLYETVHRSFDGASAAAVQHRVRIEFAAMFLYIY
jgi:hypothetical protein